MSTWEQDYEAIRASQRNREDQAMLAQQDIDLGLSPPPTPKPVVVDPSVDATQAILDEQGKPSVEYLNEEKSMLGQVGSDLFAGIMYPLEILGAAGSFAAAPLGREPVEGETVLEEIGGNFKVAGKALIDALLPPGMGSGDRTDYGQMATERFGIDSKWALPIDVFTDPSIVVGAPAAKVLQSAIRGQQLVAPGKQMGMWESVGHEVLGLGSPKELKPNQMLSRGEAKANTQIAEEAIKDSKAETQIAELNTPAFDELLGRADAGDADAARQVIDALDTDPRVAKYAESVDDKDVKRIVSAYNKTLGNPRKAGIIKDKKLKVTQKTLEASINTNIQTIPGTINMARGPKLEGDLNVHFGNQWDYMEKQGMVNEHSTNQRTQAYEMLQRKTDAKTERDAYILRQKLLASSENLSEMAKRAMPGPNTRASDQLNFDRAEAIHKLIEATDPNMLEQRAKILSSMMTSGKDDRAVLRSINKLVDPDSPTSMVNSGNTHARKLRIQMLAAPAMRGNPYAISRFMAHVPKGKVFDAFFELYANSILSGPMTHAVNLSSNAFLTLWSPSEAFLEATSAATRGDFFTAKNKYAETIAKVTGIGQGTRDAFKHMVRGTPLENMGYPATINNRHEIAKQMIRPAITAEALQASGILGSVIDGLGKAVRLPGNALMAEDKFMKIIHNRMEINSAAMKEAIASTPNLKAQRTAYNIRRMNPSQHTIEKAEKIADYYTFTNELGTRGTAFAKGMRAIPAVRYFIPFFNTPVNIAKMGLRNSFAGNIVYDFRYAFEKTARGDRARAKISMGTVAAGGLIMSLPEQDYISGSVDMSTPKGKFKASKDIPPYSIRVGDEWYSYEKIEPMRSILGLAVNYKEALAAIEDIDPKTGYPTDMADELFSAFTAPLINTVGDSFMLEAIGGIMNIIDGVGSGNPEQAWRHIQRTTASMIPYSSATKQFTKEFGDGVYRKADTYIEMLKKSIPGLSSQLPAGKTLWGDDQMYPDSVGPSPLDMVTPIYTQAVAQDWVDKEIVRLDIPIPGQPKAFTRMGVELELTPKQRETFSVLRGKGFEGTPTLKEIVTYIMSSPDYKEDISDITRRSVISSAINNATDRTRKYMFATDYDLQTQFDTKLEQRQLEMEKTRGTQ